LCRAHRMKAGTGQLFSAELGGPPDLPRVPTDATRGTPRLVNNWMEATAKQLVCVLAVKPCAGSACGIEWSANDAGASVSRTANGFLAAVLRPNDTIVSVHGSNISAGITSASTATAVLNQLAAGRVILCVERTESKASAAHGKPRATERTGGSVKQLQRMLRDVECVRRSEPGSSTSALPSPRSERREISQANLSLGCHAATEPPVRLSRGDFHWRLIGNVPVRV